jgi:hypothetical protein
MNVKGLFMFVIGTATVLSAMALFCGKPAPHLTEHDWLPNAIRGLLFLGVLTVAGIFCIRTRKPTA